MSNRIAVLLAAVALAGCQSLKEDASSLAASVNSNVVGGLFRPLGGAAVEGSVTLQARQGYALMQVHVTGLPPGVFRVMLHATGNCSSRNGFSAGAPWGPPGREPAIYTMATNSEGTATLSVRVAGLVLEGPDGAFGRSVVVHAGGVGPLDAVPDVPNNRIACAVVGAAPTLNLF